MRQQQHINTQWRIDDSARIHTFPLWAVCSLWKMLTTLTIKSRSEEGTLHNHFELFCAIIARSIVSNVRTYDEWISEHSRFNSAEFSAAIWAQREIVRPKTDAVHGIRRTVPLSHTFFYWHSFPHTEFRWTAIEVTHSLASKVPTFKYFNQTSLVWVAFFAIIKQIKCGWLYQGHVNFILNFWIDSQFVIFFLTFFSLVLFLWPTNVIGTRRFFKMRTQFSYKKINEFESIHHSMPWQRIRCILSIVISFFHFCFLLLPNMSTALCCCE